MRNFLVMQTDFSFKSAAVSVMHGVCYQVDRDLIVEDVSHEVANGIRMLPVQIWHIPFPTGRSVLFLCRLLIPVLERIAEPVLPKQKMDTTLSLRTMVH